MSHTDKSKKHTSEKAPDKLQRGVSVIRSSNAVYLRIHF